MIESQRAIDEVVIDNQAMTSSATVTANLDTSGSSYVTIRILLSKELNTNGVGPTISLLGSDDTVVTNFATIVADKAAVTLVAAKEVRYEIDMRGKKRYLRLSISTGTATNDNISVGAVASKTMNHEDPNTTTEMGDDVVTIV